MIEAALKVVSEQQQGTLIPLPVGRFLIGREEDCHLRPNSDLVSRHHCVFTNDEFTLRVRDLGSTNGTLVNGESIRSGVELKSGDSVIVGKLEFQVLLGDDVAAGTAAIVDSETAKTEDDGSGTVSDETTTAVAADETHTEIPATAPQTPEVPVAPQPEVAPAPTPQVGVGDTAFFPAPVAGYPPPPGYAPQPQYPYAAYPPGYPGYPGYYPQGTPYPQQGYPQQPAAPAPATPPEGASTEADPMSDVRLPDPSTTGAKPPEPPAPSAEGEAKPGEDANVPDLAGNIIQQYLQRRPPSDS